MSAGCGSDRDGPGNQWLPTWRSSRFHLRGAGGGLIAACMKIRALFLLVSVLMFSSCEERKEIIVTETREATTRDTSPKLFASSDERFRDAKPSPVKGNPPQGWLALPASQFRLLNYRFGESGKGEVWVSLVQGSVLDNVNRWLKEFGGEPVDQVGLEKLSTITLAGATGIFVTAEGVYKGAMGAPPKPDSGLAGVVASVGGQILTVKMVGPKAEVQAAKPVFEAYVKSLRMAE